MSDDTDDAGSSNVIAAGKKAWNRVKSNATKLWADWLLVAEALAIGSEVARDACGANEAKGGRYNRAFSEWLSDNGFAGMHKATRAALINIHNNLDEVVQWRDGERDNEKIDHLTLNHPVNVWSKYRSATRIPDPDKPKKVSIEQQKLDDLYEENDAQIKKIEKLEEQNEALQQEVNSGGKVEGRNTVAEILDIIHQSFNDNELETFIDRLLEVAEKRGMLKWQRSIQMEMADA